jgi:FkbM family methyltransferase
MPASLIIKIPTGELRGKKWYFGSGSFGMVLGTHEREATLLFSNLVRKGQTVYDVGAHVGYYTLLSSELVGKTGVVVSFEPNPRNLKFLEKNLSINHYYNVKIIRACLGDKTETVSFSTEDDSSTGRVRKNGNLRVKMFRLDDLIGNQTIPPPDFVKIDVEGAEMLVFEGSRNTFSNYHPKLVLSTHGPEIHNQCLQFLKSNSYDFVAIDHKDLGSSKMLLAY